MLTNISNFYNFMCLAIPGKIIKIKDSDHALCDFNGLKKEINTALVDIKEGDFVVVHAGFAISIMTSEDAEEIFNDLKLG